VASPLRTLVPATHSTGTNQPFAMRAPNRLDDFRSPSTCTVKIFPKRLMSSLNTQTYNDVLLPFSIDLLVRYHLCLLSHGKIKYSYTFSTIL